MKQNGLDNFARMIWVDVTESDQNTGRMVLVIGQDIENWHQEQLAKFFDNAQAVSAKTPVVFPIGDAKAADALKASYYRQSDNEGCLTLRTPSEAVSLILSSHSESDRRFVGVGLTSMFGTVFGAQQMIERFGRSLASIERKNGTRAFSSVGKTFVAGHAESPERKAFNANPEKPTLIARVPA